MQFLKEKNKIYLIDLIKIGIHELWLLLFNLFVIKLMKFSWSYTELALESKKLIIIIINYEQSTHPSRPIINKNKLVWLGLTF